MLRTLALVLAAFWVASPGCALPGRTGDVAPPEPAREAEATWACGALSLVPSAWWIDAGGNVSFQVRFENCGTEPLEIEDQCRGLLEMSLSGPVSGEIEDGPLFNGVHGCQALRIDAGTWLVPGQNATRSARWDASGAPPGEYVARVGLRTVHGNRSWDATARILVGPPQDKPASGSPSCEPLTLEPSAFALDVGGNVSFVARFQDCGADALPLSPLSCHWPRLTPSVSGPAGGVVLNGTLGFVGPSCGPILQLRPDWIVPGQAREVAGWWNGTVAAGCAEGGGWIVPCGSAPAPSGEYVVSASMETMDGNRSWQASAAVLLRPWTEDHGGWREYHPAWRAAPSGGFVATDGSTFSYETVAPPTATWQPSCAPDEPGHATWVQLSASPCRWAPFPGVGKAP